MPCCAAGYYFLHTFVVNKCAVYSSAASAFYGKVIASDVLILDQTKSGDELQKDAAFIDYVEFIDRSPGISEADE